MPLLEKDFYYPYKSKGLEILAICLDASEEEILPAIIPLNLSYHIIVDREGTAAEAYDVRAADAPLSLILDRQGIIRYRESGYDPDSMRELVEQLL